MLNFSKILDHGYLNKRPNVLNGPHYQFDTELNSWVKIEGGQESSDEETLSIEKDLEGYWFSW